MHADKKQTVPLAVWRQGGHPRIFRTGTAARLLAARTPRRGTHGGAAGYRRIRRAPSEFESARPRIIALRAQSSLRMPPRPRVLSVAEKELLIGSRPEKQQA